MGEKKEIQKDMGTKFNDFIEKLKEIVDEKSDIEQEFVINLEFINILKHEGEWIQKILTDIENDPAFNNALNTIIATNNNAVEYHASHVLLHDLIKIYNLSVSLEKEVHLKSKFILAYFFELLQGNDFTSSLSLARINQLTQSEKFDENINKISQASFFNLPKEYADELLMPSILVRLEHRDFKTVSTFLYRIASLIVKADNTVSEQEKETLKSISNKAFKPKIKDKNSSKSEIPADDTLEKVLHELHELVGLRDLKKAVEELTNFLKIQKIRGEQGLKNKQNSMHAVYMGPPGTGKTTIARLVGRIYKHLGFLKSGHLIETDRAGLVAGYVGQTAMKIDEVIKTAIDGVLFIDEAYSLAQNDNQRDFGNEAIETLLKRMEDYRDNLVVIVAGYPDEMKEFIQSNPGLQSRFNRYYNFDHYQPIELMDIFKLFALKTDFVLSEDAQEKLMEIFERLYEKRNKSFGNARVARNLFEQIIEKQAGRIVNIPNLTKEILMTIEEPDIPEVNKTVEEVLVFKEE
jgi:SpoVK/Ycf46/Vps4 family AAA+-type ATPase